MAAGAAVALSGFSSLFSGSSPQGAFLVTNQMQLFLLLPLMAKFMSYKVKEFLLSCKFFTLSISLIIMIEIDFVKKFVNLLDFKQPITYLEELGMDSGSSFIINSGCIISILWFIPLHWLLLSCSFASEKRNCVQKLISKTFTYFTFSIYIRVLIQTYVFIVLSTMYEIKNYMYYNKGKQSSVIIAFSIFIIWPLLIFISIISWFSHKDKIKIDEKAYTREFYSGIKKIESEKENDEQAQADLNKIRWARLYSIIYLLRRFIQVSLIVFLHDVDFYIWITILFIVQFVQMSISTTVRYFESTKDQVWEVINDIIYLILISSLFYLTSKEKWTKTFEDIFIWIVIFNTVCLWLISLFYLIKKWILKIYCCRSKNKVQDLSISNDLSPNRSCRYDNFIRYWIFWKIFYVVTLHYLSLQIIIHFT